MVHSPTSNMVPQSAQNYAKYHLQQQQHQIQQHPSSCNYKSHSSVASVQSIHCQQQHQVTVIDSPVSNNTNSKRKRSWSRAVFSQLQRKGLEIQFQIQKYITKPDRRKLAARLGLTDAQVFQICPTLRGYSFDDYFSCWFFN